MTVSVVAMVVPGPRVAVAGVVLDVFADDDVVLFPASVTDTKHNKSKDIVFDLNTYYRPQLLLLFLKL